MPKFNLTLAETQLTMVDQEVEADTLQEAIQDALDDESWRDDINECYPGETEYCVRTDDPAILLDMKSMAFAESVQDGTDSFATIFESYGNDLLVFLSDWKECHKVDWPKKNMDALDGFWVGTHCPRCEQKSVETQYNISLCRRCGWQKQDA